MRMVVDLPAPLLPRKPKISPRATSKLTSSTATNCAEAAASGRGRRSPAPDRRPASGGVIGQAPAPGALRRAGRWRSRACDRARPAGARPARRARRCWWRRRPGSARRRRARLRRRRGSRRRRRRPPRGSRRARAMRARTSNVAWRSKSSTRVLSADARGARFTLLGGAAAAVPQRPRQVDRRVPRRLPVAAAREDARVRARVVVAAADRDLRTRGRPRPPRRGSRPTRRAARAPAARGAP